MTREASQGVQVTALHVVSAAGTIVQPLDFSVDAGKTLAVIGESGSGKSMTARALTGLLPRGVRALGEARIGDHTYSLAAPTPAGSWRKVRGRKAVLLLQDPFTSLSYVLRCGDQIAHGVRSRLAAEGVLPQRDGSMRSGSRPTSPAATPPSSPAVCASASRSPLRSRPSRAC